MTLRVARVVVILGLVLAVSVVAAVPEPVAAAEIDLDGAGRPEEGEVLRLYRSVLGRQPDRAGFEYWVTARIRGLTLGAMADGFLGSDEYHRRFGSGSDPAFVDRVYRNVLGRRGDRAGVEYWLGALSRGLPRTDLVLMFSESAENRVRTGTAPADLPRYRPAMSTVSPSSLGSSWRPGCPVGPTDLRAVEVDHVGFDGAHHRGTLIVHVDVVDEVVAVFRQLYAARYPVAGMAPVSTFGGDDNASMAANNSSAFNCRPVTGGRAWSRHAHGTAIDINPIQNPYVAGRVVLPVAGTSFIDRGTYHPAMIRAGDVVTTSFAAAGWRWGGDFQGRRDYHHFQR